jgi:hypothetical protein
MRFFIFKKVSNKERDLCRSKINGSDPKSLLIQTRFAIRLDRRFFARCRDGKSFTQNRNKVFINRTLAAAAKGQDQMLKARQPKNSYLEMKNLTVI